MKEYYGVCSSYYNDGRVIANIVDIIKCEKKPESTYKETDKCDIYMDWFETKKEAEYHIKECKKA